MTSKTFKSAKSTLELGVVRANTDHVRVWIEEADKRTFGMIDMSPSDAPALALAILEAAGVEGSSTGGLITGARIAVGELKRHVAKQERITAEAKEQAELEDEAFNLYRAYMAVHEPMNAIGDWQMLAERTKEKWLAVARKAREMSAEK